MRLDTYITLNILFVHSSRHHLAPWLDGSTRYRCYHLAEALRLCGVRADVSALSELRLDQVDRYHTVFVLRPQSGRALDRLVKRCHRMGIHTVADVDDLIFDPEYAALSPSVVNRQASEASVRKRFASNQQALFKFDELTVATEPLAQHWRQLTKRHSVSVVPNGLSQRWLSTPLKQYHNSNDTPRTITYLPGSSSHDKDFQQIQHVLMDVLHKHSNVRLHIVGTLNTDESLLPAGRVSRSGWVDYCRLPQIIADSSVTLAPLAPSPFTYAKSHIKYIESVAFGTPVVCSPTHDICRHQSPGLTIANNDADWHNALNDVLSNPLSSTSLEAMMTTVRKTASAEQSARILMARWKDVGLQPSRQAA